jgi:hypothetical protein
MGEASSPLPLLVAFREGDRIVVSDDHPEDRDVSAGESPLREKGRPMTIRARMEVQKDELRAQLSAGN